MKLTCIVALGIRFSYVRSNSVLWTQLVVVQGRDRRSFILIIPVA